MKKTHRRLLFSCIGAITRQGWRRGNLYRCGDRKYLANETHLVTIPLKFVEQAAVLNAFEDVEATRAKEIMTQQFPGTATDSFLAKVHSNSNYLV